MGQDIKILPGQEEQQAFIKSLKPNSLEYWKWRAKYREMMNDPTYVKDAQSFAYRMWILLQNMEII